MRPTIILTIAGRRLLKYKDSKLVSATMLDADIPDELRSGRKLIRLGEGENSQWLLDDTEVTLTNDFLKLLE